MIFVGIDLGTSGCRAIAINEDNDVIANTRLLFDTSEQTPSLWWNSTKRVLSELIQLLPTPQIDAICVDGTSSTVMLCSPDGGPISPTMMYYQKATDDTLTTIQQHAPAASAANSLTSSLAKVLQLKKGVNKNFIALHQADWVTGMLCQHWQSDENNALKLGYNPITREWPDWLQHYVEPDQLPKVRPPGTPIAPMTLPLSTTFKLSNTPMICSGTTDSTAAFVATGANTIGDAVTSLGSTLVLKILTDKPIDHPAYGIYSHRLKDQWIVGGASNSGGQVLKNLFSDQELATLSLQLNPNQLTGLHYYPLPSTGERFPVNDPNKQPELSPTPKDRAIFLQAILEGISEIENQGYTLLKKFGCHPANKIYSVGGGTQNDAWTQIRQTKLGNILAEPEHNEAAYGSAKLAKEGFLSNG